MQLHDTNKNNPGFGEHFAVLNLDFMKILTNSISDSAEGSIFMSNCTRWNDSVRQKDPRPLIIFTALSFSSAKQPELSQPSPFAKAIHNIGLFEKDSPDVEIDPRFEVDGADIVLSKTRWYAGSGNSLEQILKAQNIDNVILVGVSSPRVLRITADCFLKSGLASSGVILSTVYHLLDLDYSLYVIMDNVLDLPIDGESNLSKEAFGAILQKLNVEAVSLTSALEMLDRS